MSDLDALLAGIVADPHDTLRWLIVADWLDDHGQPDRAELLRLHRELIRTCCVPDQHPERTAWQSRFVELIDLGVKPCVPQHTLMLPGGIPLVGHFIPPGSFLMGSEEDADEKPVHKVTLTRGFFIGIHPITRIQWRAVMGTNPSQTDFVSTLDDARPVDSVSWDQVTAFRERVSELAGHPVRLPTEAEWEYACRAGTTTHFHWGDGADATRMNARHVAFGGRTTAVNAFAANSWGLFDCHGNVEEWCRDWENGWGYWSWPGIDTDPVVEGGDFSHEGNMVRGGSWVRLPQDCRSAARGRRTPTDAGTTGFRVVFTPT